MLDVRHPSSARSTTFYKLCIFAYVKKPHFGPTMPVPPPSAVSCSFPSTISSVWFKFEGGGGFPRPNRRRSIFIPKFLFPAWSQGTSSSIALRSRVWFPLFRLTKSFFFASSQQKSMLPISSLVRAAIYFLANITPWYKTPIDFMEFLWWCKALFFHQCHHGSILQWEN